MFEVLITGTADEEELPGTLVGACDWVTRVTKASLDRVTRLKIFIMLTTFG